MPAPTSAPRPGQAERLRARRRLLLAAKLSFVLVGTLPWWLPPVRALLPLGPVGELVDASFVLVCHRLPARTLTLGGAAMPVCSRCAGIFGGLALGAVIGRPRLALGPARVALLCAGLLLLIDVLLQDWRVHPLWHCSRLLTGALLGYLLATTLMAAIARERPRAAGPSRS